MRPLFFCAIRYFFHFLPELPLRYSIVFQNFPVLSRKPYNYCDKNGARKHTLCLLAMGFSSFKWNTKQKIWHKMGRRKSIDSILCQKFKALGGEQTTNRFSFYYKISFCLQEEKARVFNGFQHLSSLCMELVLERFGKRFGYSWKKIMSGLETGTCKAIGAAGITCGIYREKTWVLKESHWRP